MPNLEIMTFSSNPVPSPSFFPLVSWIQCVTLCPLLPSQLPPVLPGLLK